METEAASTRVMTLTQDLCVAAIRNTPCTLTARPALVSDVFFPRWSSMCVSVSLSPFLSLTHTKTKHTYTQEAQQSDIMLSNMSYHISALACMLSTRSWMMMQ